MIANKGRLLLYVITDFDRSRHRVHYRSCRRISHARALEHAVSDDEKHPMKTI